MVAYDPPAVEPERRLKHLVCLTAPLHRDPSLDGPGSEILVGLTAVLSDSEFHDPPACIAPNFLHTGAPTSPTGSTGGRHHCGRSVSPARREIPGVGPLHPLGRLRLGDSPAAAGHAGSTRRRR